MRSTLTRVSWDCSCCSIVPLNVLRTYAGDPRLTPQVRTKLKETFLETGRLKAFREAGRLAAVRFRRSVTPPAVAAAEVQQQVFDCQHRQSLPGRLVNDPANAADEAVKTVYSVTGKVAEFYQTDALPPQFRRQSRSRVSFLRPLPEGFRQRLLERAADGIR